MANDTWYMDVESKLYSIVKTRVANKLKNMDKPITGVHYTNENASNAPSAFPTWYFHEMQPVEIGNDLENKTVNGLRYAIEIVVYDTNKNRGQSIMRESTYQMKQLEFDMTASPITLVYDKVYQIVARFSRTLGATDFENM